MRKVPQNLLVKIILASVLIILIPVAVNQLLLKEFFLLLNLDENTGRTLRGILSGLLLSPVLYFWFYARLYQERLADLDHGKFVRGMIGGALLAFFVLFPVIMVFRLAGIITAVRPVHPEQFWYGMSMLLVLAATEELFFRGILYKIIEARYSWPVAVIITAVLFTAAHLTNDNFTWISILSVVSGSLILGLLFTVTHSLWMPVSFHFTWNMIQVVMGLPVSGLSLFSGSACFKVSMEGPVLLTGGDFGMENSLLVIAMLCGVSALLIHRIRGTPAMK